MEICFLPGRAAALPRFPVDRFADVHREINVEWTLVAIRRGRTVSYVHVWNEAEPLLGKLPALKP